MMSRARCRLTPSSIRVRLPGERVIRLRVAMTLGCCAMAVVAAAAVAAPIAAAAPTVKILDFAFNPATVTIVAGETVTWRNTSATEHTVTADDGTFDSGALGLDDQFANVFDQPGTYRYHCAIHSSMTGTVVVQAAAATTATNGTPLPTPPSGTLPPDFKTPVPVPTVTPTPIASSTASDASNGRPDSSHGAGSRQRRHERRTRRYGDRGRCRAARYGRAGCRPRAEATKADDADRVRGRGTGASAEAGTPAGHDRACRAT